MTFYDEHGNVALCGCGEPAVTWGTASEYKGQWWCEEHTPWEMPGRAEKRENKRLREEVDHLRAREAALVEVVRAVAEGQSVSIDEDLWGICLVSLRQSDVEAFREQARALLASEPPATSKPTHLVSVSDLASMDLRHCNVEATCACGNPVAGMFIQDTYDREEVSEFFASAYRVHQSWCPSAHTISLKVHELPERSAKLASNEADEAK